ncbi:hypothetical protein WBQ80_14465 [Agromyces sp. CCNWLW213]
MNRPPTGKRVHLVRWLPTDADWVSEVRTGRYVGGDELHWVIEVDGVRQRLARSDWSRFVPEAVQPPANPPAPEITTIPTTARPMMEPAEDTPAQ